MGNECCFLYNLIVYDGYTRNCTFVAPKGDKYYVNNLTGDSFTCFLYSNSENSLNN